MNLLDQDIRCEMSLLWPQGGVPRLYVSKGLMTREEIGQVVADVIGLVITWAAEQGVHVSGEIAPPEKP